jgi:F0F1-type ATP synthase delta subunit
MMFCFKDLKYYNDLRVFFDEKNHYIRKVLVSKFFSRSEWMIINQILEGLFSKDFLLALENGRSMFVSDKLLNVLSLWFDSLKSVYEDKKCLIISSYPLDSFEKEGLEKSVRKVYDKVYFDYEVMASIIGGFIIKIDNSYLDASFKKSLLDLKKEMQDEQF